MMVLGVEFHRPNAIVCNGVNALKLLALEAEQDAETPMPAKRFPYPMVGGMRLFISKHLPTFIVEWVSGFGDGRDLWIEWEPSDQAWTRPAGLGRLVETDKEAVYLMRLDEAPIWDLAVAFIYEHGRSVHD